MSNFFTSQKKTIRILLWILMIAGFLFTRLYRLDSLPAGLHHDEVGSAYDGWCLANYGVDRYQTPWPIFMQNYGGGGQSIMLVYLIALLTKIFGGSYSIWWVRLPMTLFSALTLVFTYLTAKEIFDEDSFWPELTGLSVVFMPYFVMQCRFGYDCNLMLGAASVFLYFFTKGLKTAKTRYYVLSGITGGIMLYTYSITHIILPVFLIFAAIYLIVIKQFKIKKWLVSAACMLPLAIPLLYFHIRNMLRLPEGKFLFFTVTSLRGYRIRDIRIPSFTNVAEFFKGLLWKSRWTYDTVPGYPPLTYAAFLLLPLGFIFALITLVKSIKKKNPAPEFVPLAWFISVFMFFTSVITDTYRINGVFAVTLLLCILGLKDLVYLFKKPLCRAFPATVFVALILVCCVLFNKYYFTQYEKRYPLPLMFGRLTGEAVDYVKSDPYLSARETYTTIQVLYYLLGSEVPPSEFHYTGKIMDEYFGVHHGGVDIYAEYDDNCNYIYEKGAYDIMFNKLRTQGFKSLEFKDCVLFYK